MDIPGERFEPSTGERLARGAIFAFLILAIITLAFALGWGTSQWVGDDGSRTVVQTDGSGSDGEGFSAGLLDEIHEIVGQEFVDKESIDADALEQAAIEGILESLDDPHSTYVTPEQMEAGALDLGSSYQGIGASVTDRNGDIEIIAPFRDSPAEQAGIQAGDIILEVDGEPTDGWTDQMAVEEIRGEAGTEVTLTVQHADGTVEELTIVRGEIPIESIYTEPLLEVIPGESGSGLVDRNGEPVDDIGYINIAQFHEGTVDELRTALEDIEARDGMQGLILDLRANPGGLLSTTVDAADQFLNEGTILIEEDADGNERTWSASEGGIFADNDLPIVILQDSFSASGAEVLAAALRDNGRGVIIGEQSFGKGTVNRLIPLDRCGEDECGAVYLSIGRWLTPEGEQIEGAGVEPDVTVELSNEEYQAEGDLQIFAAIDHLRGQ